MVKFLAWIFKIRYQVSERTWPARYTICKKHPFKSSRNIIEWWEKGGGEDKFYKAESCHNGVESCGFTVEEAVQGVLDDCPVWIWDRVTFWINWTLYGI